MAVAFPADWIRTTFAGGKGPGVRTIWQQLHEAGYDISEVQIVEFLEGEGVKVRGAWHEQRRELAARAAAMREQGVPWRVIASELGYASHQACQRAVQRLKGER